MMKKRNAPIQTLSLQGLRTLLSDYGPKTQTIYATGDEKNNLILWRFNEENPLLISDTFRSDSVLSCLRFGSLETDIVIGSSRGLLSLWDVEMSRTKMTLKGHSSSVDTASVSRKDPNFLVSGSNDLSLKLWDLRTRNNVSTIKGHTLDITCTELSPDLSLLVSGSKDGTSKLWELRYGNRLLHSYSQSDAPVSCLLFNPELRLFCSGGHDRVAREWELD
jgi:WD40 repeat protein